MKPKTHQSEEDLNELCREVVQAARASDEEVYAAANAPFLYQRLRAQIAAEQKPIVAVTPQRTGFLAALGALPLGWRWTWIGVAAGLVFAVLMGWQSRQSVPSLMPVAQQSAAAIPSQTVTATTSESASASDARQLATAIPTDSKPKRIPVRQTPRTVPRFAAETVAAETEIATDFMPLTYAGNRDDEGGQIVRMEVPREALVALGIPMAKELTSERIKADIKLGDDGVALAIRLISNNNE